LGRSYQTEGRNEEAIKNYEQAIQIADDTDHNGIKARAYQFLGNVSTGTSKYEKAIEYYQKAREISPDFEADEMEVIAYQRVGYNHLEAGQYEESIEYYNEVIKLASQLGDKKQTLTLNAYLGLGSAFSYSDDFDSSRKHLLKALTVAQQIHDKVLQKEAYKKLGYVYYKSCKFDAGIKSYLKVQEISHDLGERKEEAKACLMLGATFQELRQHKKAIDSYQQSLKISEELEDKEMQVVAIQRLGTLYLVCCEDYDYKEAIEWYEKALDTLETQPSDQLLHVKALTGLGDKELGDKEQVVAIEKLGTLYLTLASICCIDYDYKKAIEWYEKALEIPGTESNYHLFREKVLTGLGAAWFNLGDSEKANEYILEAQNVAAKEADIGNIIFFLWKHNTMFI
jgi:tetratricopeptide (TPR) repeat protein